jgi:hypothetical protein
MSPTYTRSQARWHIPLLEITLGVDEREIAEDICSVSDEVVSKLRVDVIRPSREPLCCPEAVNTTKVRRPLDRKAF